jgi:hypothetical protein
MKNLGNLKKLSIVLGNNTASGFNHEIVTDCENFDIEKTYFDFFNFSLGIIA